MPRYLNRLSQLKIAAAKKKGLYADGGGLYLQVAPGGSKSWLFRFKIDGRARDMGLGPLLTVTLAEARAVADECRRQRLAGADPIETRKAQAAQKRIAETRAKTFRQAAEEYIAAHAAGWRNDKHKTQWQYTLEAYAFPVLGDMPIAEIGTQDVLNVLRPLWLGDKHNAARPETASRVRGRIEAVIDAARADDDAQRANSARWKGHLQHKLPRRSKMRATRHHPALPYGSMASFMTALRSRDGIAPRALEFVILTAARTSEALGARWSEFDLDAALWTVPGERMKSAREHRVPLSPRAVEILKDLAAVRLSEFVFFGMKRGRPLSNMALLMLLRDLDHEHITVHGFRSSFRDWAAETTNFPREVAEAALAHVVGDKAEAAYRRGDLFAKRRELMDAWTWHCEPLGVAAAPTSGPRHLHERTAAVA